MSKWSEFRPQEEKKGPLYVPMRRANRGSPRLVFDKPNRWGFSLKVAIRQQAKRLDEYHLPVENEVLPTSVRSGDGDEIKVHTLGRWAFGVPGYQGHLMFEGGEPNRVVIYYPEGSPKELLEMLEKAVKEI